MSADELLAQSLWWKGPSFLQSLDAPWPENPVKEMINEIQTELVKNHPLITSSLVNIARFENSHVEEIIDSS